MVELPSLHTETVTFEGQAGDRVVIDMKSDWTATGVGELYAPGDHPDSDDPILSHDLYGWYALDVPELTATGTYTLVMSSQGIYTTDYEVTVYKSDIIPGELDVDGETARYRPRAADTLALSLEGQQGDSVSIWAPGMQEWSEVDGAYDATMRLLTPTDSVIWDSTSTLSPYSLFMEAVTLPTTGTYTLEVDPHWDASGDIALRAATVAAPTPTPLSEGVRASTEVEVPGQDVILTFDAELGDRVSLLDIIAPYDAEVSLEGPSHQLWEANVYSRAFDDVWIPETGTYELRVDGHLNTGPVRAKYIEVPTDQPVVLAGDGTPQVVSPASDRQRINFEFGFEPFEPFGIRLASTGTLGGALTKRHPWAPEGESADYLDPGVVRTVAFPFDWGQGSQYGLTLTPDLGSSGSVTAWVVPTTTPPDAFGEIIPDGGLTPVPSRWNEFEVELQPDTTYRMRVIQDESATADYYAVAEDISIEGTTEDGSAIVEFSTPPGLEPTSMWVAISRSVDDGNLSDAPEGAIEIYSTASTPKVQTYSAATAWTDVDVRWAVDAVDAPVDGYAVTVDQTPSTDPGTTVTQTDAFYAPASALAPGNYWVHVRAVDGQSAGPVAHVPIQVAASTVTSAPAAPAISPGSPGAVTSQTATISVDVPSTAVGAVGARFIVESGDGKQRWVGDGVLDQGLVKADLPGNFLKPLRSYDARAQFVDANNAPGVMGPAGQFVFDPVAPIVPAPACDGTCNAANTILFEGVIGAENSQSLDLTTLTNTGDGNWAEYVDLRIEAAATSDALMSFKPGVANPENELPPTMLVPSGEVSTVRVVPEDIYTVTATNDAASPADVTITAIGWGPGWTAADDAQEAAIEAETDRLLATGDITADWQEPTIDSVDVLPGDECIEDDDVCVTFSPPESADEEDDLESLNRMTASDDGSGSSYGSEAMSATRTVRTASLNMEDEPVDCSSGSPTGRWVVTDRFNACGVFTVNIIKPSLPLPTIWNLRAFHRVKLSNKSSDILYQYKIRMRSASGPLADFPVKANVKVDCSSCRNGDVPTKSTGPVSTSSLYDNESEWAEQRIPIEVFSSDTHLEITETGGALPKWSFDLAGLPDLTGLFPRDVWLPAVHCDGGNKTWFGSKYNRATSGCVLHNAAPPVLTIPSKYPNHADLVEAGQELPGHPGELSDDGFPLSRLPVWVVPQFSPVPQRNTYYLKNRSEAKKRCRQEDIKSPDTCDEYPYASTTEGCYVSSNPPGRKCEVLGTSRRENSGAGGTLGAFLYKYRIRVGEKYFVNARPSFNPEVS